MIIQAKLIGFIKHYLLGWDHNTNLLDGLGKLIRFHSSVVVKIKIFE